MCQIVRSASVLDTMPAVKKNLLVMVFVLLLAAGLRLWDLQGVPPGLQHDEVFYAHDALSIRQGQLRLFFADNQGREPLFIYLLALSTSTIGNNGVAIRLPAVFSGLLAIALTFRWAYTLFGRRIALTTAALMAVGFWAVWLSRAGLRVSTFIPMVALFGWLFSEAFKRTSMRQPALRWYIGAGAVLGLSFYTYAAAYILPVILLAFIAYLAVIRVDLLRLSWRSLLTMVAVASLLFIPLALTIATEGYSRVGNTATVITALRDNGDLQPLLDGVAAVAQMFTRIGDPQWRYNVSGRPVFSVLTSAFFAGGFFMLAFFTGRAVFRMFRRQLPNALVIAPGRADSPFWSLLVLWLLLGLLPSVLTDQPPSALRTTTVLPLAYLFAAIGVEGLRRVIVALPDARGALPFWSLIVMVIVGISAYFTIRDYFGTWATHPEVQRIYRVDLAEAAQLLRNEPDTFDVAISTTEPNNLDPFIFAYTPHGERQIHWFDGANSLVLPASGGQLYYTLEPQPHPAAVAVIRNFERKETNALYIDAIILPPAVSALETIGVPTAQEVYVAEPLAFPPSDPQGLRTQLDYPVSFGDVVDLIGYQMATEAQPGNWFPLQLYFEVQTDVIEPQPWSLFVHFLDVNGTLVANRDFLGVPPSTWRMGDGFIHFHDVPVPDDLPPGDYHIEIGLYSLADGSRFPIMAGGQVVGDRLLLESVTVTLAPE